MTTPSHAGATTAPGRPTRRPERSPTCTCRRTATPAACEPTARSSAGARTSTERCLPQPTTTCSSPSRQGADTCAGYRSTTQSSAGETTTTGSPRRPGGLSPTWPRATATHAGSGPSAPSTAGATTNTGKSTLRPEPSCRLLPARGACAAFGQVARSHAGAGRTVTPMCPEGGSSPWDPGPITTARSEPTTRSPAGEVPATRRQGCPEGTSPR